jgi:hypothetical protein
MKLFFDTSDLFGNIIAIEELAAESEILNNGSTAKEKELRGPLPC